jgi:hypothetical protein
MHAAAKASLQQMASDRRFSLVIKCIQWEFGCLFQQVSAQGQEGQSFYRTPTKIKDEGSFAVLFHPICFHKVLIVNIL